MSQRFDQVEDGKIRFELYVGPLFPLLAWGEEEFRPFHADYYECERWYKLPWIKICFLWIETATERKLKGH